MNSLVMGLVLGAAAIWGAVFALPDNNLHVVVCNVGQGDAILVSLGTSQMLIDGGPGNSVLGCLARHTPFYDRQLEVMLLTHPQADHLNGLIDVAKRYNVLHFIRSDVANTTVGFKQLLQATAQVPGNFVTAGETIKISSGKTTADFKIVWPTAEFMQQNRDRVGDLNDFAVSGILTLGDFDVLLTADADSRVEPAEMATGLLKEVEVLKVPHHGSKTGMLDAWLGAVKPQISIISVGKNNSYGHPSPVALDQLRKIESKVFRTDINGDVEVVSDGSKWWYNLQYGN